jgi:cell division protein FtsQ
MQAVAPLPADIRLISVIGAVLWFAVVATALAASASWLARQPLFAISAIQIEGDTARSSEATIRANAAPRLAGNFFTVDLDATREAFEAVPWVRRAIVRRVWPNRIAVRLEEHRPAATWGDDRLVNAQGEVFDANLGDVEDDALPRLEGPQGTSALMLSMLRRVDPVLSALAGRVESLTLSGRGSWRARLADGPVIELGRGGEEEVAARAERFVRTLSQVTEHYQRPLEYADLRHADGYAVRLEGISTAVPEPDKATRAGRNRTP